MNRRGTSIAFALVLFAALVVSGCAATESTTTAPQPTTTALQSAPDDPSMGTRLAPGLYDLADGTSEAYGTLEWRDLEGGFWAVIGGTEATGDVGTTVAVIANAAKDDPTYVALAGRTVRVVGNRLSGASVRMAGPEIEASSISEISDTGAAYE
ncbi:MAG: hypothetical protein KKA32_11230 [Actinobacteria bacterium]|nr:hypothetical protein [Actinomycetota bacterium]